VAVFDEAQAVKNSAAARTRAVTQIRARFRLCLTGTPLENHIGEFHSIMETAVPGLFGDRKAFLRDHEAGLPVLDRVRPFLLRRTKDKILSELPPKVESDAYFPLSDSQRECYTRVVGEVRKEVLAAYEDRPAQQAGIVALAALLRLRQICISPAMLPGDFEPGSPKIDYLVEQLAELAEEGHAALVFSQFVKALKLTASALESAGLPFLHMDGSTPTKERKALVEGFQSGTGPGIFLISLKTGGSGLNLTRASYVYHLDPWWNPAVENQASDRVHRIGQKSSVFVQRLLMRHTVEEKMMGLKQKKQALFAAVLEQGDASSTGGAAALTAEDFRFLIDP
jgi:non-specific serine/threonine protein kinase